MSLQNRIDPLLVSRASKEKSNSRKLKLFDNLTKYAIVQELHERNVKFTCTSSAKDLNALLEHEVHGIQRVPALVYNNSLDTLESLNYQNMKFFLLNHYMTLVTTSKIYIKKSLIMSLKIRKKMSDKYWTYLLMERMPKTHLIIERVYLL